MAQSLMAQSVFVVNLKLFLLYLMLLFYHGVIHEARTQNFLKTNISNPLMRIFVRIRRLVMLVFRNILRKYLMDAPWFDEQISAVQRVSNNMLAFLTEFLTVQILT